MDNIGMMKLKIGNYAIESAIANIIGIIRRNK